MALATVMAWPWPGVMVALERTASTYPRPRERMA
jgi:hypothetical protein